MMVVINKKMPQSHCPACGTRLDACSNMAEENATRMNDKLSLWTVYAHPSDYPDRYVARLSLVGRGSVEPTASMIAAPTLETLREHLLEIGLTRLARDPADDAKVVETWL